MKKPYILCVDDDKTILMSLKIQLKHNLGDTFNYETAESAEEAWEIINELVDQNKTIPVIISDWMMPKTKGDEFLISVHQKFPSINKFILTGHADEKAIIRVKEQANLKGCLGKPWDINELVELIKKAVDIS